MEDTSSPTIRGWIVSAAAAIALFVTPIPPWVVDEFYSRDLYPWLQRFVTAASNLVPGAVMDLFLVGAAVLVLYRMARLAVAMRRRGAVNVFLEGMKRLIRAGAGIALAFMLLWGFNYRRLPLETTLEGGAAARPTEAMLVEAVSEAVTLSVRLRPRALETLRVDQRRAGRDARGTDERGARATQPRAARAAGSTEDLPRAHAVLHRRPAWTA